MEYTKNLFDSVEHRNAEFNSLFYGADYLKGQQINNFIHVVSKFDLKFFMDAIRLKAIDRKLRKYQNNKKGELYFDELDTYESYMLLREKKIVIYTCILGGYDNLKEPLLGFENVEYICFTDDIQKITETKDTKWIMHSIPESISANYDKILLNRYIKMHPKELFPDADYAIYVDGNIGIQSFLGSYLIKTKVRTVIAIFSHSQRQCAYVESKVCINRKKGKKEAIEYQMKVYNKSGFPRDYGLYECTIIAVDLKNALSTEIMNKWWREFLHYKSYRDQLSLPYVMWRFGLKYTDIGLLGENIFKDPRITVYSH